jgi:hypothetical protein
MPTWLSTAVDQFIDRKPEEVIVFLVITLFIAVAASGLFRLLNRGRTETSLLLTVVLMATSIVSILTVNLYDRYRQEQARRRGAGQRPPGLQSTSQYFTADALAVRVLSELDSNHDNYLSVEEATTGAAEFVEKAIANATPGTPPSGDPPTGLDAYQIRRAIRDRMGPRVPGRSR